MQHSDSWTVILMTGYGAGANLERETRKQLVDNGYFAVRAAGSHGIADIVALKPGEVLLVQCKTDGRMVPAERAEIISRAAWLDAVPLLAYWAKEGRKAREVAFARVQCVHPPLYLPWTPDYGLEIAP
jgi:Holliday junction resolvase